MVNNSFIDKIDHGVKIYTSNLQQELSRTNLSAIRRTIT